MFRDNEIVWVIVWVVLAWIVTALFAIYELFLVDANIPGLDVTVAIGRDMGGAVGVTLLTVGTWEVIMVLAKRMEKIWRAQERREAQRENQKLWEAWNERRMAAESRGEAFDEPPPKLDTDSANG